jgi:hypothetical protein
MRASRPKWFLLTGSSLCGLLFVLWTSSFCATMTFQWSHYDLAIHGGVLDFCWGGGLTYSQSRTDISLVSPKAIHAVTWLLGVYRIDGSEMVLPLWIPLVAALLPFALLLWRTRRHEPVGRCPKCDYDLAGNTSGICPECGTAVPAPELPPGGRNEDGPHSP